MPVQQAANPELSVAQIQQLTALAFANDDNESAPSPGPPRAAIAPQPPPPDHANEDIDAAVAFRDAVVTEHAAAREVGSGPDPADLDEDDLLWDAPVINSSGDPVPPEAWQATGASVGRRAVLHSPGAAGSASGKCCSVALVETVAANVLVDSHPYRPNRVWGTTDAAQTPLLHQCIFTPAALCPNCAVACAGDAQARRPSFLRWFGGAQTLPPARPAAPGGAPAQQQGANHAAGSAHNTEWQWNLGGPSLVGTSSATPQQRHSAQHVGAASGSAPSEWRWGLGGPQDQSRGRNPSAAARRHGPSPGRSSSRDSAASHRPSQRRRMLPELGGGQLPDAPGSSLALNALQGRAPGVAADVAAASRPDPEERHGQQGWRRLLPRFLGQILPSTEVAREAASRAEQQPSSAAPALQSRAVQTEGADQPSGITLETDRALYLPEGSFGDVTRKYVYV